MISLQALLRANRLWRETHAQDMIEYALMAGFVAVSAGAVLPDVGGQISTIFSSVTSVMALAINATPSG